MMRCVRYDSQARSIAGDRNPAYPFISFISVSVENDKYLNILSVSKVFSMARRKREPKKLKQEFIKAIKAREYLLDNGQHVIVMRFPDGTGTVLMKVPSGKSYAEWKRVVRQKNYLKKIMPKAEGGIYDKIGAIIES